MDRSSAATPYDGGLDAHADADRSEAGGLHGVRGASDERAVPTPDGSDGLLRDVPGRVGAARGEAREVADTDSAASPLRIEVVRWLDSASINGGLWVAPDEIAPDAMTEDGLTQATVGFVHDESDEVLLLVQSIGPDRVGAALAIPKKAIAERKALGELKP